MGSGGTDYPPGDTEMRSVQGGGIHTGGWLACLDEVSQDLENLRGVGDDGDNLHGFVTTRAAQGAPAVLRAPLGRWASCRLGGLLRRSS
jgi:hypothetical protein